MALGTTFLAGVLHLAVSSVMPAPPPIVVNRLAYDAGIVTQDRSVNRTAKFSAVWEAEVISAKTGQAVPGCMGRGDWDYAPGNKVARMPLAEWVGSASCKLEPGQYQLFARYRAGEWGTTARSDVFEVLP
jgi:hypothetical protein